MWPEKCIIVKIGKCVNNARKGLYNIWTVLTVYEDIYTPPHFLVAPKTGFRIILSGMNQCNKVCLTLCAPGGVLRAHSFANLRMLWNGCLKAAFHRWTLRKYENFEIFFWFLKVRCLQKWGPNAAYDPTFFIEESFSTHKRRHDDWGEGKGGI